jgi:Dyp-type peroxidase family
MTLADVQGNVICGYGSTFAHFVFARVADQGAARAWLRARLGQITYNESWKDSRPDHTLNVAFTHAGLLALGVHADSFKGLDAFRQGMAARAAALGDLGVNSRDHWQPELRDPHLLVVLSAWRQEQLADRRAEIEEQLTDSAGGLEVTFAQPAATLGDAREHFGFGDGFSQPAIAGAETGPRHGEGTLTRWGRWRDLALGEFILGHADEGGLKPAAPAGPLGQDATFMVVRKLEQDVAAFRAYVREQAGRSGRQPEWIAAKMVGRWPNGSPLASHPDRPGPPASAARETTNRFRYGDDPQGLACPLGAHVRRSNPRDALGWEGRLTQRHRMLRRGISYGPRLADGATEPDGHERGLMFVCLQSSIERQFEFVQRQWLGDGNVFGLGDDQDPLAAGGSAGDGDGAARGMVIQGSPPLFLSGLPRFVRTRGGGYFLLPGRAGLRALASSGD